jgi:hypothetical protein
MSYNTYAYDKMRADAPADRYRDFESKYEARIQDSREYKQYVRRQPYYMWDGKVPLNTEVEVVPMKAIHLTSDNLERLMREQELMDKLMDDAEYGKKCWTHERKDQIVRNENPAVDKAYRNYQMLLELCRK